MWYSYLKRYGVYLTTFFNFLRLSIMKPTIRFAGTNINVSKIFTVSSEDVSGKEFSLTTLTNNTTKNDVYVLLKETKKYVFLQAYFIATIEFSTYVGYKAESLCEIK